MAANYLHLPGVVGNFVWVPGIANLNGTGTLEFIAKVNLDGWTPAASQMWISKWTGSAGYLFFLESTSNDLKLMWRDSGPARIAQATVTPTVTDGNWLWVRAVATEDGVDRDVIFDTSTDTTDNPDDVIWTQLGAEVVVPFGAGDLTTNTSVVFVGAQSATVATMAGSIAAARINFAGVTQLDIDFTDLTAAEVDAGSFTEDSGNAATVTIAGTAWTYVRLATPEEIARRPSDMRCRALVGGSTKTNTVVFQHQNPIIYVTSDGQHLNEDPGDDPAGFWSIYCDAHRQQMLDGWANDVRDANGHRVHGPQRILKGQTPDAWADPVEGGIRWTADG